MVTKFFPFFEKKLGCHFLDFTIIYHRAKNQEGLMNHYQEKLQTVFNNSDFIASSINECPIKGALRADTINY